MAEPKETIYVNVEYFDGQDEDDVGHPYYVVASDELHFVTDGATFEELLTNVRECLALCLEDADSIAEYGVKPDAKVTLIMNLPTNHAQTA
jgi:predicted RNase H-like HicB family nuclease